MRAGPDAQVISSLPIVDIVARVKTSPRVVGDLVTFQPGLCKSLLDQLRHRDFDLLGQRSNNSSLMLYVRWGPLLYRQVIGGEMGKVKAKGLIQISSQIRQRLIRACIDKIHTEVLEACLLNHPKN